MVIEVQFLIGFVKNYMQISSLRSIPNLSKNGDECDRLARFAHMQIYYTASVGQQAHYKSWKSANQIPLAIFFCIDTERENKLLLVSQLKYMRQQMVIGKQA